MRRVYAGLVNSRRIVVINRVLQRNSASSPWSGTGNFFRDRRCSLSWDLVCSRKFALEDLDEGYFGRWDDLKSKDPFTRCEGLGRNIVEEVAELSRHKLEVAD